MSKIWGEEIHNYEYILSQLSRSRYALSTFRNVMFQRYDVCYNNVDSKFRRCSKILSAFIILFTASLHYKYCKTCCACGCVFTSWLQPTITHRLDFDMSSLISYNTFHLPLEGYWIWPSLMLWTTAWKNIAVRMGGRLSSKRQIWKGTPIGYPWRPLIYQVLFRLANELGESTTKGRFIHTSDIDNIVRRADDVELNELKDGVRDGVERNNWATLVSHRKHISTIGCSACNQLQLQQNLEMLTQTQRHWTKPREFRLNYVCFPFPI